MNGLINIYKESGMTSFDVVAKVKKIMHTKTVGHTGTLDPNATGVLIVAVGKATKTISYMENDDKIYSAELTLGITTDTEDIWGNILTKVDISKFQFTDKKIRDVIKSFVGKQLQIPPMYSALKVNGKKLYELAREGKEVERKPREIEIFDISDILINNDKALFKVHCSKGTYIRTLCKDIGSKLGCGAAMSALERIKVGNFRKEFAVKLDELEKEPIKYLINLECIFEKYPIIELDESEARQYINGIKLHKKGLKNGRYRVYIDKKFYGICKIEENILKSEKRISE